MLQPTTSAPAAVVPAALRERQGWLTWSSRLAIFRSVRSISLHLRVSSASRSAMFCWSFELSCCSRLIVSRCSFTAASLRSGAEAEVKVPGLSDFPNSRGGMGNAVDFGTPIWCGPEKGPEHLFGRPSGPVTAFVNCPLRDYFLFHGIGAQARPHHHHLKGPPSPMAVLQPDMPCALVLTLTWGPVCPGKTTPDRALAS